MGKIKLPHLHNYSSRDEWEKACWGKIIGSRDILNLLTASDEKRKIVMRAAVMEQLFAGNSYTHISQELWLSSQTISSIKKSLLNNLYDSYRQRSKNNRKAKVSFGPKRKSRKKPGRYFKTKYGRLRMSL